MSQPTRQTGRMDRRTFFTAVAGGAVTWAALNQAGVAQTTGGTVETAAGKMRGHVRMGIHSFKGIPYGRDPIRLRQHAHSEDDDERRT